MKIFWKGSKSDSLELLLSPILNPGSPLINTSHTKSFSKAILTKSAFSYWGLQTIFTVTPTKLLGFCHSSTRQSTRESVALPHLITGFSLQVLFPWMPEGIKSFFHFLLSMKHGKNLKAPVPRHSIDATQKCQVWRTQRQKGSKQRKLSTKKHLPGFISRPRHQKTGK